MAILIVAAMGHIYRINTNVETVFWKALDNALQERGVGAEFVAQGDQKSESYSTLNFTPNPTVQVVTKAYDSGDQTVPVTVTHNVGTPDTDYLRYLKYQSADKIATPEQLKEIENVWTSKTVFGEEKSNLLYNQYIYTFATNFPVIFANLNDRERAALLADLKKEGLSVKFDQTKTLTDKGRKTYGYVVSLDISGYVRALQAYGKGSQYSYFDRLDPEQFKDAPPIKFEMIVDVLSKQVTGIENNGVSIRYPVHGIVYRDGTIPRNTITSEELQKRQQSLQ